MFTASIEKRPALKILDALYEHDDFMGSINTMVDLGCGEGEDLIWWATRTTRDDTSKPLNIRCTGVDIIDRLPIARNYNNVVYQPTDFEGVVNPPKDLFDVLWCHDAFQFCINPLQTLARWRQIASPGAMLIIAVPRTLEIRRQQTCYHLDSKVYYHYTMVSLIHMLSVNGWDCRNGFFLQEPKDSWIRAVVYNSNYPPQDPKNTTWYDLIDRKLLPESAERSIMHHGYLQQQDLVIPWLDHNLTWMGKQ